MEFSEFAKERARLCNVHYSCHNCPIGKAVYSQNYPESINRMDACLHYCITQSKSAEEIVLKWSQENPYKTNGDKFAEVFGYYPIAMECPIRFTKACKQYSECTKCDLAKFWKKEYKETTNDD